MDGGAVGEVDCAVDVGSEGGGGSEGGVDYGGAESLRTARRRHYSIASRARLLMPSSARLRSAGQVWLCIIIIIMLVY